MMMLLLQSTKYQLSTTSREKITKKTYENMYINISHKFKPQHPRLLSVASHRRRAQKTTDLFLGYLLDCDVHHSTQVPPLRMVRKILTQLKLWGFLRGWNPVDAKGLFGWRCWRWWISSPSPHWCSFYTPHLLRVKCYQGLLTNHEKTQVSRCCHEDSDHPPLTANPVRLCLAVPPCLQSTSQGEH